MLGDNYIELLWLVTLTESLERLSCLLLTVRDLLTETDSVT